MFKDDQFAEEFHHIVTCKSYLRICFGCAQGLILSLRIEREKHLREIFRLGAAIRIQSEIRRYLVHKGFIVSHPKDTFMLCDLQEEKLQTKRENLKTLILSRLKVLLITGR